MYITETTAKQFYNKGIAARQAGKSLRSAIIDMALSGQDEWNRLTAFEMGYRGVAWEVKQYRRYGAVRINEFTGMAQPSKNYMDNQPEHGISVITDEWAATIAGIMFVANAEDKHRPIVTLHGVDTGYTGGDGEPLILPIRL